MSPRSVYLGGGAMGLVLAVAWTLAGGRLPGVRETPASTTEMLSAVPGYRMVPSRELQADRTRNSLEALPVAPLQPGFVTVQVLSAEDSVPIPGLSVVLTHASDRDWNTQVTDEEGRAAFGPVPPGHMAVFAAQGGVQELDLEPGGRAHARVWVPAGLDLEIQVVDEAGVGIHGAEISLSLRPLERQGVRVGKTDALGFLRLRDVEPNRLLVVSADGYERSDSHLVASAPQSDVVRIELVEGGRSFTGHVVDERGALLPGAMVWVGARRWPRRTTPVGMFTPGHFPTACRSDARAVFEIQGLPTRALDYRVSMEGYATTISPLPQGEGDVVREIVLVEEALVRGVVVDQSGAPVAGAYVYPHSLHDKRRELFVSLPDGRFEIRGLGGGDYEIVAKGPEFSMGVAPVSATGGKLTFVEVRLDPRFSVTGMLIDPRDNPLGEWRIGKIAERAHRPSLLSYADPDGRFAVWRDMLEQGLEFVAIPPAVEPAFPLLVGLWKGEDSLVLRLPFDPQDLGRIELCLDGNWGVYLKHVESGREAKGVVQSDGWCMFEALRPDRYEAGFYDIESRVSARLVDLNPGQSISLGAWTGSDIEMLRASQR